MDDFSYPNVSNAFGLPPSPNNFVKPGKRPQSSMVPTIVTEAIDGLHVPRLVVGAAGGTRITTSVALTIINNIMQDWDLETSVNHPRLHHQLLPMVVSYQNGLGEDIIQSLQSRGHATYGTDWAGSVVGAVARMADGKLMAKADNGKSGGVAGMDSSSSSLALAPSTIILLLPITLSSLAIQKVFSNPWIVQYYGGKFSNSFMSFKINYIL